MLPRFLLNLMTLKSKVWPMSLSRLRTGRRSTWEPGKNAFTPPRMVTLRPPFTRWVMVPAMSSSRSQASLISSQTLSLSAFSLERMMSPSSFSLASTKTSTRSPAATLMLPLEFTNSLSEMTPSDLYPMSTKTLSLPTLMTWPTTMSPSLRLSSPVVRVS